MHPTCYNKKYGVRYYEVKLVWVMAVVLGNHYQGGWERVGPEPSLYVAERGCATGPHSMHGQKAEGGHRAHIAWVPCRRGVGYLACRVQLREGFGTGSTIGMERAPSSSAAKLEKELEIHKPMVVLQPKCLTKVRSQRR